MPAAIPAVIAAAASYGATAWAVGAGVVAAGSFGATLIGAGAALATSTILGSVFAPKAPNISAALDQPGAARTQSFRQPTAPHEIVFGRIKKSGPIAFIHSATDDEGRADGYFYSQVTLASHECRAIGDVYFNDELSTHEKFEDFQQIGRNLGTSTQVEDADFLDELGVGLFGGHWLRGRANIAVRIKVKPEPFPNGLPNLAAIVEGNNAIYDPR